MIAKKQTTDKQITTTVATTARKSRKKKKTNVMLIYKVRRTFSPSLNVLPGLGNVSASNS